MNFVNIISNNPKNIDCLYKALEKTFNATTINAGINIELTIENNDDKNNINVLVLDYTSKFGTTNQIYYKIIEINLEDDKHREILYNQMVKLCDEALKCVPLTKTENNIIEKSPIDYSDCKKTSGNHKSIFQQLIYYEWYENKEKIDIFDMATDLFIKMAQRHLLMNGNKRSVVLMITAFLSYFSFYAFNSWQKLERNYLQNWYKLVNDVVIFYQHKEIEENTTDEETLKNNEIKKFSEKQIRERIKDYLTFVTYFKLF